jgi:hypothetical protein
MFDKAEILARLQNGDTMDEIAKEMSEALNAAQQQYQEETIKANAEKIEAERVMNAKRVIVDDMLDCLCDYLSTVGEVKLIEELRDVDTDEVVEALDSILAFTKSLEALKGLEFPLAPIAKRNCGKGDMPKVSVKMVDPTDADVIIKSFLKGI